jgi:capsular polysaccharide biosynthesis protein
VPGQQLVIAIGAVHLSEIEVRRPAILGFLLPAALLATQGRTLVTLIHQNAARPIDVGSGGDDRSLSLSVSVARLWCLPVTGVDRAGDLSSNHRDQSAFASAASAPVPPSFELVTQFESLGDNGEFGLVQRLCRQEPLGLFRFATINLRNLSRGLRCDFGGIGDPDHLRLIDDSRDYVVYDQTYAITYRTHVNKDSNVDDDFLARQSSELKLFADKLMQDVRNASKIFILKRNEPLTEPEVWPVFVALNKHADNTLLWVTPTVEGRPPGTVERIADGLLRGYIDRSAPPTAPQDMSLEVWLEICRNAWSLVHDFSQSGPAIYPTPQTAPNQIINRGSDNAVVDIEAIGDFALRPVADMEFQSLAAPDIALPASPRFTFGSFPGELAASYYRQFGIGSVGIHKARNVALSGEFLISRDEVYFRCPEMNVHEAHIRGELNRLAIAGKTMREMRLPGQYVALAGPGNRVYGHWLIEYLPKIGLLDVAGYDVRNLRYLIPNSAQRYVHEWLYLLGIRPEQVFVYDCDRDVITADELLMPTVMHNGVRVSSLLQKVATFMLGQIGRDHDLKASAHGPRILLSRGKTSQSRKLLNRAAIEEIAARQGFAVVQPEQLSLLEQIELFHGARAIIGEYGSALHGSIFSPAGTVVCSLRGTNAHPGFIQSGIGAVLEQPTGYVFGASEGADSNAGFHVDEPTFKACMDLIFNPALL